MTAVNEYYNYALIMQAAYANLTNAKNEARRK